MHCHTRYKLLHFYYYYLAKPKNSATRRLAAGAKGWVGVGFSDVITRGALADQPWNGCSGGNLHLPPVGEIFGEGEPSSYKYVKPA